MNDLIRREDAIDAALIFIVEYCGAAFDYDMQKMLCDRLNALPSAEPVKNELTADFVDTAEKAAKVEIMSEKDAQATLDYWKMYNHISETDHE